MNYYNENDPNAAAWLRQLIADGYLPPGEVDERDIREVQSEDIRGYRQHHWFAGIGGWAFALDLAGFPATRAVWTGSCPCQPFSAAGQRNGKQDERDLWPAWHRLIRESRPAIILGEQVASAVGFGWLDRVFTDLEDAGYAGAAAVLPACSVGAPHIRNRLFWVANAESRRDDGARLASQRQRLSWPLSAGADGGVADAQRNGTAGRALEYPRGMGSAQRGAEGAQSESGGDRQEAVDGRADGGLADADGARPQGRRDAGERAHKFTAWAASQPLYCRDGKWRRVPLEPALFPLADGVSARVVQLRGAGNAIVPQLAARFVIAAIKF